MAIDPQTLPMLLRRAARGDERAFTAIVTEFEGTVYRFAYHIVGNREDAMDVSQEVFVKLWRSLSSFRGDSSFQAWLLQVTKHTALDLLRKQAHAPLSLTRSDKEGENTTVDIEDTDTNANPQAAYEKSETVETVRRAIAHLPEDQRQILILRDMEGLSYETIAQALSLEIGTVKSRLHRARNSLCDLLRSWNFL